MVGIPFGSRKNSRRFLAIFFLISASALTAITTFNLLVDPFSVYRIGPRNLEFYKPTGSSRITKAASLRCGDWTTLLLGSSLTEVGLDPRSPVWKGKRVFNAGLISGSLFEIKIAFDYAIQHNDLQQVYLIVSERMFDPNLTVDKDFNVSEFNPEMSPVDYHLNLLVGYGTMVKTVHTLQAWRLDQPDATDRWGFRRSQGRFGEKSPAKLFGNIMRGRARGSSFWLGFNRGMERMALLDQIAERCRNEGILLTVVIPPCHAMLLEIIEKGGNWQEYEDWKRELAKRAGSGNGFTLWDFAGYHRFTAEYVPQKSGAATKWFWDALHFKHTLGELMLNRIIDQSETEFGAQVNAINIENHLESIRQRRSVYRRNYPHQLDWVNRIMNSNKRQAVASN